MIEVAMCEEDCVQLPIRVGGRAVQRFALFPSLKHSAINEYSRALRLDHVGRAGHFSACSADDSNLHLDLFFADGLPLVLSSRSRTDGPRLRLITSTASFGESVRQPKYNSSCVKTPCFIMNFPHFR